jgi:hypothetical protein
MPLSAAKNISQKSAARGLSMSQDRPSPLPSRYSIVSSRAGSLPACLNVTDDSEPSVWFSLEGLSLRTKVAHDETALFLSKTTFSVGPWRISQVVLFKLFARTAERREGLF